MFEQDQISHIKSKITSFAKEIERYGCVVVGLWDLNWREWNINCRKVDLSKIYWKH